MREEIVQLSALSPDADARLDKRFAVIRIDAHRDGFAIPDEVAQRARGIVTSGGLGLPREVMDRLPRLAIIAVNGIGTERIDLSETRRRGICVTTTPDVLTPDVADMAMALILAGMRNLVGDDRYVREGRWAAHEPLPLARRVSGKRLGIVGLGKIGSAVAERARGFDMAISYHGRHRQPDCPYPFQPSLPALARAVDVLVITVTGGSETRHLVDRTVIEALGPDGLLVNVARGSVVDEAALVEAIAARTLGGAALDVFEYEPFVPPALIASGQVVLQPHRGSATTEARAAMADLVVRNLEAFFAGEAPLTPVR
ncbi:MAG: 2-hydroxyacid dehydrogenase [Novosphingobium sp.]|nr:2-hydroxyacid dehydrogenase [Novosphingobium sp.]